MNSEQFQRLCYAVEPFQTNYVEIETEDLRALIDDKLAAYERIKHLENELAKAEKRIKALEDLYMEAVGNP